MILMSTVKPSVVVTNSSRHAWGSAACETGWIETAGGVLSINRVMPTETVIRPLGRNQSLPDIDQFAD